MLVCRRTYLKVATLQYHKGKEKSSGFLNVIEEFIYLWYNEFNSYRSDKIWDFEAFFIKSK
jgi:hypothetical protein